MNGAGLCRDQFYEASTVRRGGVAVKNLPLLSRSPPPGRCPACTENGDGERRGVTPPVHTELNTLRPGSDEARAS